MATAALSAGVAGRRDLPHARSGPAYWMHGYGSMLRWYLLSLRMHLPLLTSVQILAGAGFVLGISLFFAHIPPQAALYVATGVPVVNLITVGLVFEPQIVADQRTAGTYDFMRSLPVPRSMTAMAWYTTTLAASLPAAAIALWVGVLRYHYTLEITPAIVPAILLVSFTGTMMGYAVAHAITVPMTTRLISQALIFVVFGFSPIMFPASQLPNWLADINRWLPFESMAIIMRSALVRGYPTDSVTRAYVVVAVWAALSAGIAAWAVGRRR